MNTVKFHETLKVWAKADDPDDLAFKILGSNSNILKKDVAECLSSKIKHFLNENTALILPTDLSDLKNLQDLVSTFTFWAKETLPKQQLYDLENTLEKTVSLAMKLINEEQELHADDQDIVVDDKSLVLASSLLDIFNEYASMSETIKLSLAGRGSAKIVKISIENAKEADIIEFRNEIIARLRMNPNDKSLRKMIHTFFLYAPLSTQELFFKNINCVEVFNPNEIQSQLIMKIVSSLPKNMKKLHIILPVRFNNDHLIKILNRLNKIEYLKLSAEGHNRLIYQDAIRTIATCANLNHLTTLALENWNGGSDGLRAENVKLIASSPEMGNLEVLSLPNCAYLDKRLFAAILQPPTFLNNLSVINVEGCDDIALSLQQQALDWKKNSSNVSFQSLTFPEY